MGILILVIGTTAFGVYQAGAYLRRLNNLYEIRKAFCYIQGEIRYLNTPLPETLEQAAKRIHEPCSQMFCHVAEELDRRNGMGFQEVWQQVLDKEMGTDLLEKEARTELLEIGGQLGCLDGRSQERAIEYFLEKWDGIIQKRCEEKKNRLKLYYVCGVMSGLLVVLILI